MKKKLKFFEGYSAVGIMIQNALSTGICTLWCTLLIRTLCQKLVNNERHAKKAILQKCRKKNWM